MKRLILPCSLLLLGAAVVWSASHYPSASPASQLLTPEAIGQLEPELCEPSALTQLLTVVPIAPHSYSTSLDAEQLALIDEYKPTDWRKLWVLRLPAAYITQRTCDLGRKNWIGEGDHRRASQRYELALVLTGNETVPATRAQQGTLEAGFPVIADLHNRVWDPDKRHHGNAQLAIVNGHIDERHPRRCREEEGEIAGLVRFRRIDPRERGGIQCGSRGAEGSKWEEKIYGRKIGELTYEFIVQCSVNCRVYTDYHGWDLELTFPFDRLGEWPLALDGVRKFLDQHTVYLDHDDPNARR